MFMGFALRLPSPSGPGTQLSWEVAGSDADWDFAGNRYREAGGDVTFHTMGLTFSRASVGWYFDPDGVLASAAIDAARFAHTPLNGSPRGLLLEGARTNTFAVGTTMATGVPSTDGSSSAWETTSEVAPDGVTTWPKITKKGLSSDARHYMYKTSFWLLNTTYAWSVFYKPGVSNLSPRYFMGPATQASTGQQRNIVVSADTLNTVAMGNIVINPINAKLPNNALRFGSGFILAGTGSTLLDLLIKSDGAIGTAVANGENPESFDYVWGLQVEVGAEFPSSPIITTSVGVTRAKDIALDADVPTAAFSRVFKARTAPGTMGNQVLYQVDDGTAANRIRLVRNSAGVIHLIVTRSSVDVVDLTLGTVANDTEFTVAIGCETNNWAGSVNGGVPVVSATGDFPSGLTTARLGHSATAAEEWFGTVARVAKFGYRTTNTRLVSAQTSV